MKKIKIEFTNERIIPASGLAVVGAILGKSDFVKRCNRMDVTPNRSQHQIKNGDVLLTYIGLLTMGKPAYESVHEFDDDPDFYKYALGIVRSIPSEETLRQRMSDFFELFFPVQLLMCLSCLCLILSMNRQIKRRPLA